MKKAFIIVACILALIVIFLVSLPFWLDINELAARQIPNIERSIHRKLSIGDVRLTVVKGLGIDMANVRISNAPEGGEETFVSARHITVGLKILPLFKRKILIDTIRFSEPFILIERNADGSFNFDDIIAAVSAPETEPSPSAPEKESTSGFPLNIEIARVDLKNGRLQFRDATPSEPFSIRLEKLNAALSSISLNQKMRLQMQTDLPDISQAAHIHLSGDIGPLVSSSATTAPSLNKVVPEIIEMDTRLAIRDIDLLFFQPYLNNPGLQSGRLDGTLQMQGSLEKTLEIRQQLQWHALQLRMNADKKTSDDAPLFKLDGPLDITAAIKGRLDDVSINGQASLDNSELTYGNLLHKVDNVPCNIQLQALKSGPSWQNGVALKPITLQLSSMKIQGAVEIEDYNRPRFQADLRMPESDISVLESIVPVLAAFQLQGKMHLTADGRGTMDDLSRMKGVTARMVLNEGALTLPQTGQRVDRLDASLSVQNGGLHLHDTTVTMKQSSLNIDARVDNIQRPHLALTVTSPFLDIDSFLPTAAEDIPGKKRPADTAETPSRQNGKPSRTSAPDLSASGSVKIMKGIYQKTDFQNFHSTFHYQLPIVSIDSLKTELFSGILSGSGKINFKNTRHPEWRLNLQSSHIDINRLLASLAGISDILRGNFSGSLLLAGNGRKLSDISQSLNGNGQADIVNGELTSVNLLNAIAESLFKTPAAAQLGRALFPEQTGRLKKTVFKDISGKFDIDDAKIKTKRLQLKTADYRIDASGFVGLDSSLDLDARVHLPPSLTQPLAEHKIYKYLLDNEGNLELPFAVKGSIVKPVVQIETETVENLIKQSSEKVIKSKFEQQLEKAKEKLDINIPALFK